MAQSPRVSKWGGAAGERPWVQAGGRWLLGGPAALCPSLSCSLPNDKKQNALSAPDNLQEQPGASCSFLSALELKSQGLAPTQAETESRFQRRPPGRAVSRGWAWAAGPCQAQ